MFGVFNAYEKQLWHDWIADDWQPSIRRVSPGSWGLPEEPEDIPNDALNVAPKALIQRMAGNRHATPDGSPRAWRAMRSPALIRMPVR